MWIFLQGGLIMPSQAPLDEADTFLTDNGRRELQVRARLTEHLEYFIRTYVEPYTDDYSTIEQTPHMDYNCRFYMTHDEFAMALGRAAMDIDYRKFKPTAERIDPTTGKMFKSGKRYHGVLNAIWGDLLRLAPAGGSWGPRSATNPNGYESTRRQVGRGITFSDQEVMEDEPGSSLDEVVSHMSDEEFDAWWKANTTEQPPTPAQKRTRRDRKVAKEAEKSYRRANA